jgi:hypothetical protein
MIKITAEELCDIYKEGVRKHVEKPSEIDNLVARDVFNFERFNPITHRAIRLFKSRMVREVKNKSTKPYEKSRLVVQGYNDVGKKDILT